MKKAWNDGKCIFYKHEKNNKTFAEKSFIVFGGAHGRPLNTLKLFLVKCFIIFFSCLWKIHLPSFQDFFLAIWLADPGEARGCSINSLVIHSFSERVSQPFPPTAWRRRHAQTVRVSTSSYKIDYVIMIQNFLNPKGHQNASSGSKVTAILLKGWIWPIGGASAGEGLPCSLHSRLVFHYNTI